MIIKDVIYGIIHVSDLCKSFIDTFEFQRLRRIKQLGLAYFVYPGAVHTRFEHSLGVMHLCGKIADRLGVTQREKELLELAGLLHDVGHVAFSHLMDYILEEKNIKLSEHEERSIYILKRINSNKKLLSDREIEIVSKMIKGDFSNEEKPFLFEIVSNKIFGLDADRLDYLQRDMYHTGLPSFQADYILECIGIRNTHLAIKHKALSEIEMLYESRKRLLLLVCRHKTVMKIEKLIREALTRLEIEKVFASEDWLHLDDFTIHCILNERCADILEKIYTRDLPDIDDEARLLHIKYVDKNSIEEQIKKINWL